MTPFEELLPLMLEDLPGCDDSVKVQTLRDAWRNFCHKAERWRPRLVLNRVENQTVYPLTVPFQASIITVLKVCTRNQTQIDNDEDGTPLHSDIWRISEHDGGLNLHLISRPRDSLAGGLAVIPVLEPDHDCMDCEAPHLLKKYALTIVAGAKYQLARMPGKKWSSAVVAAENRNAWLNGVGDGRRDALRQYQGSGLSMGA